MLYDMTTKPEYEANIVASEILLDSNEVLDYIFDYHYSAEEIARCMGTDINLVALKIAHLNELGYQGFEEMTNTMLNEFVEKVLVHEREIKGSSESPQTIEIYFNFIGQFRTPGSTVPLTAEEQEQDETVKAQKEAIRKSGGSPIRSGKPMARKQPIRKSIKRAP
jgi:hypothetical protein